LLLQKAWGITLDTIGEEITVGPAAPRGRTTQSGYLKNTEKKRYARLRDRLRTVKDKLRRAQRTHEGLDPPLEPTDLTNLTIELKNTKHQIKQVLHRHNKDRQVKALEKFQTMLYENPKKAHRYIFESGERKRLDHVKLSTGSIDASKEGVIAEVTRQYSARLQSTVDPNTARSFPWGSDTDGIIPNSKGTHLKLSDEYNKHVYQECLSRLPGRKAPGPDGVPNEVLKNLPREFHNAVHDMFRLMWRHSHTPQVWKDDHTVLLYKKGDPGVVQNHRPIGLKRTIYKLWTATITTVLTSYLEKHHLIGASQAGFRRGMSTKHQLQRLCMAMEDAQLTKSDIQALYVEFEDAFGSVDHSRLHVIMETMGIPQDTVDIIKDLYQGASVTIKTPRGNTPPIPIQGKGTVQGDTLSPLLFIIYIEPLLRWLKKDQIGYRIKTSNHTIGPLAYADDLAIVTERPEDIPVQARTLEKFCTWAGIKVNVDPVRKNKTVYTSIMRKKVNLQQGQAHPTSLTIQGKHIPHMRADESYQYLGIMVNLELKWGEQWKSVINELTRKAPLITGCSGRPRQKLKLVESVMRSGIRYSMAVIPYTWEQIQGFHDILMTCARRSGGLSKRGLALCS
jgi:hypothetical protein